MILKNFFNLFNLINLTLFLCITFILFKFNNKSDIREKFFLFTVNIFLFVGLGFYYNLDGMVMLFFMSELVILLIFIASYSQLYTYYKNKKSVKFSLFVLLFFVLYLINTYVPKILLYKNFYATNNITLNDFYYFYNCYFEKQIFLAVLTVLVITVFSIFFILLFYSLKSIKNNIKVKKKKYELLKKQNIIHQNNFNPKIRIFKDKYR